MRITIDTHDDDGAAPTAAVVAAPAATPDVGTAVDAGACADPDAAAFLAARSSGDHDRNTSSSAGAAPDI